MPYALFNRRNSKKRQKVESAIDVVRIETNVGFQNSNAASGSLQSCGESKAEAQCEKDAIGHSENVGSVVCELAENDGGEKR